MWGGSSSYVWSCKGALAANLCNFYVGGKLSNLTWIVMMMTTARATTPTTSTMIMMMMKLPKIRRAQGPPPSPHEHITACCCRLPQGSGISTEDDGDIGKVDVQIVLEASSCPCKGLAQPRQRRRRRRPPAAVAPTRKPSPATRQARWLPSWRHGARAILTQTGL